jgi:hypothetical protein
MPDRYDTPPDSYDTPSDPWADAEKEGARPGGVWGQGPDQPWPVPPGPVYPPVPQPPPALGSSTYPAPGATWSPAAPEGSSGRGGRTGFVVVLSILAALILGSGALAVNLIGDRGETRTVSDAGADPTGAVTGVPGDESGEQYVETGPSVPSADPSSDAQFVTVGQCVANEGDKEEPRLAITECQDGTYEVLRRFDGATTGEDDAKAKCAQVAGYTDWYFFDSPFDALDYVLCLRQR